MLKYDTSLLHLALIKGNVGKNPFSSVTGDKLQRRKMWVLIKMSPYQLFCKSCDNHNNGKYKPFCFIKIANKV